MDSINYICVYCGSKSGADRAYETAAWLLGREIAARGCGLVYGGGGVGLMGVVADAVLEAGGPVLGVIPQALVERELGHERATELVVVDDMHQRKATMTEKASAFVAMPGGYGTLEELFEMTAWSQLEIHDRRIGLLNTDGYFDHLLAFLDHAVEKQFLSPQHRALLDVSDDPETLLQMVLDR